MKWPGDCLDRPANAGSAMTNTDNFIKCLEQNYRADS